MKEENVAGRTNGVKRLGVHHKLRNALSQRRRVGPGVAKQFHPHTQFRDCIVYAQAGVHCVGTGVRDFAAKLGGQLGWRWRDARTAFRWRW